MSKTKQDEVVPVADESLKLVNELDAAKGPAEAFARRMADAGIRTDELDDALAEISRVIAKAREQQLPPEQRYETKLEELNLKQARLDEALAGLEAVLAAHGNRKTKGV